MSETLKDDVIGEGGNTMVSVKEGEKTNETSEPTAMKSDENESKTEGKQPDNESTKVIQGETKSKSVTISEAKKCAVEHSGATPKQLVSDSEPTKEIQDEVTKDIPETTSKEVEEKIESFKKSEITAKDSEMEVTSTGSVTKELETETKSVSSATGGRMDVESKETLGPQTEPKEIKLKEVVESNTANSPSVNSSGDKETKIEAAEIKDSEPAKVEVDAKQSEPITSTSTDSTKTIDYDQSSLKKELEELIDTGRLYLRLNNIDEASSLLSSACEKSAELYGEMADESAELYYLYGCAMLECGKKENNVLGDSVKEKDAIKDSDDEEEEEEQEEEVNGKESKNEANDEEAMEVEESSDGAKVAGDGAVQNSSETSDDMSKSKTFDDEDSSLKLAWEMLEIAKLVYTRLGNKAELAETLMKLGEVGVESGHPGAIDDMLAALTIRKEIFPGERIVAETHYRIGLIYNLFENFDEAISHYQIAVSLLEKKVEALGNLGDKESINEAKYIKLLLPDLKFKIQDVIESKRVKEKEIKEILKESLTILSPEKKVALPADTSTSSDKPISNISHLVKRKRKIDDVMSDLPSKAAKQPCTESTTSGDNAVEKKQHTESTVSSESLKDKHVGKERVPATTENCSKSDQTCHDGRGCPNDVEAMEVDSTETITKLVETDDKLQKSSVESKDQEMKEIDNQIKSSVVPDTDVKKQCIPNSELSTKVAPSTDTKTDISEVTNEASPVPVTDLDNAVPDSKNKDNASDISSNIESLSKKAATSEIVLPDSCTNNEEVSSKLVHKNASNNSLNEKVIVKENNCKSIVENCTISVEVPSNSGTKEVEIQETTEHSEKEVEALKESEPVEIDNVSTNGKTKLIDNSEVSMESNKDRESKKTDSLNSLVEDYKNNINCSLTEKKCSSRSEKKVVVEEPAHKVMDIDISSSDEKTNDLVPSLKGDDMLIVSSTATDEAKKSDGGAQASTEEINNIPSVSLPVEKPVAKDVNNLSSNKVANGVGSNGVDEELENKSKLVNMVASDEKQTNEGNSTPQLAVANNN